MFRVFGHSRASGDLLSSSLYDHNTFYRTFMKDLNNCREQVVIESPFITRKRMAEVLPILQKLRLRGVQIIVNTRHPEEHDGQYDLQAREVINNLLDLGVKVLYTGGHHRKLAIIDNTIIWEGSLNILSQSDSCEIMRRITSVALADQMVSFLSIRKYL